MKRITVLLAEDHTIVREGFRRMLELEDDLQIVGEAQDGRRAVALVRELRPAVVLMDIAMPLLNGLEATRQIIKAVPATKVLILSSYDDDRFIEQSVEGGATGYLLKQSAANDLIRAIQEVNKGRTFYSPTIQKRLNARVPGRNGQHKALDKLSRREAEVLQLIAEGKPNKQIAGELSISIKTVEKHRQQVMNKLNIHDIAGLTRYAMTKGIIETGQRLNL